MGKINRRTFLRRSGEAAVAVAAAGACISTHTGEEEEESCRCDGRMVRRECGDDAIGLLGYGCMRWPMVDGPDGRKVVDQEKVNQLVDYAIDHEVNYFDSAPVYLQGQSEEATAKALLRHPREDYYIATKLSNFSDTSYEAGVALYRRSLELYQTDQIDFYLLHSVGDFATFKRRFLDNGLMEFIQAERELGHIRRLGFSFHGSKEGFDEMMALHDQYHWDFVQIQMNYVDWNHAGKRNTNASYLYSQLDLREIPIVVMEPLLGGQLAKVSNSIAGRLKEREPQKSAASWAFRFCGSFPRVLTVLSGMTYMEHLQDNVDTFENFKPVAGKDLEMLEKLAGIIRSYPLVSCTGCQYCMPCPYGIDIPGIFAHYNDCVNDEAIAQSPEQKEYNRLKRQYLRSYSKSVEADRQADHCIQCRRCVPLCPQKINIPKELGRIDSYVDALKKDNL